MTKKKNIQKREVEQKHGDGTDRFEYTPADGKTRSFKTGYDLWKYATQCSPKFETEYNERTGPFFSDWMERRRSKSK